MKRLTLPLIALAALSACDGSASDEAETPAATETGAATLTPSADTATPSPAPTAIPVAIQGRWGLVAADCEPGRSDAKGLLTITGDKLEFYESVGTLDEIEEASANRIGAGFDFTGEGMEWERNVTLTLEDGGETLVRREEGEGASPDAFRYSKCG